MYKLYKKAKGDVFMKKKIIIISLLLVSLFLISLLLFGIIINSKNDDIVSLLNANKFYQNHTLELEATIEQLNKEKAELQAKVDEAAPWFKMTEEEKQAEQQRIATEKANAEKAEQERLAKEKAEAEKKAAAEKAEQERQEKIGYDTGITFEQLARTPDSYEGKKVKFKGKVIQVSEGSSIHLRIAIDSDYDKVILAEYSSSIVSSRVLEDDIITIYGISKGLYTYQSTMGGAITVPLISVDKIDM